MQYLRKATVEDMDLLFEWANDPVVRSNSFHSEPIPYESHKQWYADIMSDVNVLQFILMDDEIPVGQIRLNIEGTEAEIGYSIAAAYRGKGYGHRILKLIVEEVEKNNPEIQTLVAKVKPDNTASKKLFESEGYEMKYSCYTRKPLKICGGGYSEPSKINDSDAILHVEIYERRVV